MWLDRLELRVWGALAEAPRALGPIAGSAQGVEALRRLVDQGLATLAGFTPSDAMHVLGRQTGGTRRPPDSALRSWRARSAMQRPARSASTAEQLCERTYEHVLRMAARVVLESALAQDPGIEPRSGRWGPLGALLEDVIAGRSFSTLLDARLRLAVPLIGIGAPAAAYYPEVARRLDARLLVPEHAAVCNAVGAVAGVVSETAEVIVNQPAFQVFRVHDPAGSRDHSVSADALEDARRVSRELALTAARRAGARDPHIETWVTERRAHAGTADDYLAEAIVRSRATGRPTTGRVATERLPRERGKAGANAGLACGG